MSKRNQKVLRLSATLERTGLSRSNLYDLQSKGLFPQSIKLTPHSGSAGAVGWLESEVEDWIQSRVAERNNAA